MGEEETDNQIQAPLLQTQAAQRPLKRTGNLWTAIAHIITGVIGSGVLSLARSMAQFGWIAGPLAMLFFAIVTVVATFLLCNCYRSPDPEYGPGRNRSYLEAVDMNLDIHWIIKSTTENK
ncbi:putative amino acid permease 7 [Quercus suber]|uniref:Amino acid permease 7 n=1 Tax=Quercus suber TaxID=58331 RepID=A0AAW0JHZ9_QUESU